MKTRLTVLVENDTARADLAAEHGLAVWIELNGRRVLFDTGQTDAVCRNALVLGIDLSRADAMVLSHGHYDHTGGLPAVLEKTGRMAVFAHPDALLPRYARNRDGSTRTIGMCGATREALLASGGIRATVTPSRIVDGLTATGAVPRLTGYEDTGGAFFRDPACCRPDELHDDQAVFVDTPDGTVVVLGCAHAGIINTLRYVRKLTGNRPIRAVLGGTHLVSAGTERMARTVAALRELDVERLYPVHCTGEAAAARLRSEFPERVADAPAGTVLEF